MGRTYRPAHSAHGDLYWRVVMWPALLSSGIRQLRRGLMARRHGVNGSAPPEPLLHGTTQATPPSALTGWLTPEVNVLPAGKDTVWFTGEGSVRPVRGRRQRQAETEKGRSRDALRAMANVALRRRLIAVALFLVVLVTAAAAYHVGKDCGAWEAKHRLRGLPEPSLCLSGPPARLDSVPGPR